MSDPTYDITDGYRDPIAENQELQEQLVEARRLLEEVTAERDECLRQRENLWQSWLRVTTGGNIVTELPYSLRILIERYQRLDKENTEARRLLGDLHEQLQQEGYYNTAELIRAFLGEKS